jgi:hypothetical protein
MTNTRKALLSTLLAVISLACFIFMPASQSQTVSQKIKVSPKLERTETTVSQSPGIAKLLEWVGIGSLLLSVWIWRKELGIGQLGPIGSSDAVSQQEAGSPKKAEEESGPPPQIDLSIVSGEMADQESKQRLEHIMQMFKKLHSIDAVLVAHELGITTHTAKAYLFLLTKNGQLRADGFPKRTIYTPARSLENKILDTVKSRISQKHGVLSERRYIRIKRLYEVDSLLESEGMTFIVEAKVIRTQNINERMDTWILQLLSVAKEFKSERVVCILALACLDEANSAEIKRQVDAMTFDSGSIPIEVIVLAESDLAE